MRVVWAAKSLRRGLERVPDQMNDAGLHRRQRSHSPHHIESFQTVTDKNERVSDASVFDVRQDGHQEFDAFTAGAGPPAKVTPMAA